MKIAITAGRRPWRAGVRAIRRAMVMGLVGVLSGPAFGLGILVPRPPEALPVRLGAAEVRVEINNNVAKTRVVQEFENPNPRQLEADFMFPVPRGADVTDFVLYMNGKPVSGEVIERDKAREIYEGIVRRMKDPGLLEWVDYNLFKVRVFPVPANGQTKIELEFAQVVPADQGVYRYTFPLRGPRSDRAGQSRGSKAVKFGIEIKADEPVRNVYSPSHPLETDTANPKQVRVTVPEGKLSPDSDFVMFYEYSSKDVALSLLATRPGSSDGYFSLVLSPPIAAEGAPQTPSDVVFVLDTSGSMLDDNKIEQARKALAYCVSQLRESDRFNIVRFSTGVDQLHPGLQQATKEAIEEARRWIEGLKASGGTNISEALAKALALRGEAKDESRIFTVVFITDGLPTVGVTDPDRILSEVKEKSAGNVRLFTFGVGFDVNTRLLDRLADETRATADYIKPGENLEAPIARFFDKISRPAMTGLKLEIPGAQVYDLYPKNLPDLFYGTQLTVLGRYKAAGPSAIKLTGSVAGKPVEFVYEKTFPETETGNAFVEKLWGTRKIAYLLDEIRQHGESRELKDEVVALAKRYGVVTPYTSFLVAEDEPVTREQPVARRAEPRWDRRVGGPVPSERVGMPAVAQDGQFFDTPSAALARKSAEAAPPAALSLQAQSGQEAVRASMMVSELKRAQRVTEGGATMRSASGRTFVWAGDGYVDSDIGPEDRTILRIKYLSDAYFAALRLVPDLKDAFALGERVRIKTARGVVEIGPEGKETLDAGDEEILLSAKK
ncbi:MAG: VIT and VWA domain-containing protein [Candidatus Sumerlaeaceae bacterium]|nr:VIT and VWA domain-containing protein [Candidatus Sumerlaeaceae bacterium]